MSKSEEDASGSGGNPCCPGEYPSEADREENGRIGKADQGFKEWEHLTLVLLL